MKCLLIKSIAMVHISARRYPITLIVEWLSATKNLGCIFRYKFREG